MSTVDVLLKPAGNAPIMSRSKWAVERTKKVAWVIEFIRRYLKLEHHDSLVIFFTTLFLFNMFAMHRQMHIRIPFMGRRFKVSC